MIETKDHSEVPGLNMVGKVVVSYESEKGNVYLYTRQVVMRYSSGQKIKDKFGVSWSASGNDFRTSNFMNEIVGISEFDEFQDKDELLFTYRQAMTLFQKIVKCINKSEICLNKLK